jgi:CDP-6-deoxy-D-xylo-4-hexulose-3-dehydrase
MKRILVTGGTGLVGHGIQHILKCEADQWIFVGSKDVDLTNLQETQQLFQQYKPTHVVHLASQVGNVYKNIDANAEFFDNNLSINHNVLKCAYDSKVKKVLSCLSTCVFADKGPYPLNEKSSIIDEVHDTNAGYALSKRAVITMNKLYNMCQKDTLFTAFIPPNIFGPHDNFGPGAHMIPATIQKMCNNQEELIVYGTGTPLRQFIYSYDLGKIIKWMVDEYKDPEPLITASDTSELNISETVSLMARVCNYPGKIFYDTTKSDGQCRRTVSNDKLKSLLNFNFTPFEEAIRNTYVWYRKQTISLPLATYTWDDDETQAIITLLKTQHITMGPHVKLFEDHFADFVGSKYAVMVNSGSSANLLAIASLFYCKNPLQKGDEVIVPAVSWATTYSPLHQYGLKIKFLDIDINTLNLNLNKLAEAITDKTRLILGVNIIGNCIDYDKVKDIIGDRDIRIVEDNCESLGATINGKQAGTHGIMGTFSTYFSHHISTVEGGVIVTDNDELYYILKSLRAHGWTRDLPHSTTLCTKHNDPFYNFFDFILPGYNVRPTEISGVIGVHQLKKLPMILENRRKNANIFKKLFGGLQNIRIQEETGCSSWFGFALIFPTSNSRQKFVNLLETYGIEYRPIVAGNFTKNKVITFYDYSIHTDLRNSDIIHECGVYIGNQHHDLSKQLKFIRTLIEIENFSLK